MQSSWAGSSNLLLPIWVLATLVIIPLGMISTIPRAQVIGGGVAFDLFLFLPLICCVPLTLWAGYAWGAVPAWVASFAMAASAEVPLDWAAMYALVSPVSLAVYALAYRSLPVRTDLRSVSSTLFFVLTSLVAAIVHSSGVFLYNTGEVTNTVVLYAQWQAWWAGSLASLVVGVGPLLVLCSGPIARAKTAHGIGQPVERGVSTPGLFISFWICVVALFAFLFTIHSFVEANIGRSLADIQSARLIRNIEIALQGHHLLHLAMGAILVISCLFWYQIVVRWTAEARTQAAQLHDDNRRLESEVHQRRTNEDILQRQTVNLEKTNAAKDRFFGILSHDLRNPMGSIVSVSSFLSDHFEEHDAETLKELLSVMQVSSERVYALLENLLDWARLQLGTLGASPETFELTAVVDAVFGLLQRHAHTKGVELVNRLAPGVTAYADMNMIRSVLMNLVSNGIKFTSSGDTVTINAEQQDGVLSVSVVDTGVGMTELQLSKLFAMDSLPHTRGTDNEVGTGLGLIICRELLENAGSSLQVSSVFGEGTTFRFTVPMDDRLRIAPTHPAADRPAAQHRHADGAAAPAVTSR